MSFSILLASDIQNAFDELDKALAAARGDIRNRMQSVSQS
jgi:hypothetical protein